MTREINMFKGITIPVKAEEGKITIVTTHSVVGKEKKPVLEDPLSKGDAVELTDELTVQKATGDKPIIGFIHDDPEFTGGYEPAKDFTAAEAKAAGVLRDCGVESVFKAVRTVTAKTGEDITAGMFVEFGTDGFEQADSSDFIALTNQSTDDKISIGIF